MIIKIAEKVEKYLEKLKKGDRKSALKIEFFIIEKLMNSQEPTKLANCKNIKNSKENKWRWRVGKYRIIGVLEKEQQLKILLITEIDKKNDTTYSHTKET